MSELLIELLCEEIPAMMQKKAEIAYVDIFKKYFQSKEIGFGDIEIFIGPRRIAIRANRLDTKTQNKAMSLKGPRIDAPTPAIDGFCKSNNIDKKDLIVKDVKGQKCYFYETEIAGRQTAEILMQSLHEPIMEYVWPKSMYWGDYKIKWVRPIQNILCVFDEKVVPFKLGHLTANDKTFGHRFMSDGHGTIQVKNFTQYKKTLSENFVVLSHTERLNIIKTDLEKKAEHLNLKIKDDPILLEEVAGLAEYPVVMLGTIDQKFLNLPSEILVSSMRTHQKYFSLFNKAGNFAPYFLFVSNINPVDPTNVIQGNEKVLSARLSDALYFYNQDSKRTLESRIDDLDSVVFHAKLGSMKAKTDRLKKLVQFIDHKSSVALEATAICKSDILTEAVGEFPNLQGIMGYYYALNDGKSTAVAAAIRDHYKPQGPGDSLPSGDSAVLALADKIDSLCGLMMAGEKPTGSKDPYALRRLALGIIRIILENNLACNLVKLVEFGCGLYESRYCEGGKSHPEAPAEGSQEARVMPTKILYCVQDDRKSQALPQDDTPGIQDDTPTQILAFIEERAKNYFKDHFDQSVVNAVVSLSAEPDLVITKSKLDALVRFFGGSAADDLLNSYKRASNILAGKNPTGKIEEKYFASNYERELFESLTTNTTRIELAINDKNFLKSLEILANMKDLIANFFENVMVMDENPDIANNRLLLLVQTKEIFGKIANFDVL